MDASPSLNNDKKNLSILFHLPFSKFYLLNFLWEHFKANTNHYGILCKMTDKDFLFFFLQKQVWHYCFLTKFMLVNIT